MVVLGGGAVSYERGTPVEGWCEAARWPSHLLSAPAKGSVLRGAVERKGNTLKRLPEGQGQNLALTVLCVPYSLDSGSPPQSLSEDS